MNELIQYSLGIIGVRGFVGKELLKLIQQHPQITTHWVSSRQLAGQNISSLLNDDTIEDAHSTETLLIESLSADEVAKRDTDIIVLALPNGLAAPFVEAIEANPKSTTKIIIDLSADYRFEPQEDEINHWIYSVPELDGQDIANKLSLDSTQLIKISNPGCYATAMQLGLAPIVDLINAPAHCFGVSGYSGAGTKPSPNNDPTNLKDNLIGYGLIEHLHEKEVSLRLNSQVHFSPHVAAFFRGINMTFQVEFKSSQTKESLYELFNQFYTDHPLVIIQEKIPVVKEVVNTPECHVGGFVLSHDGLRGSFISCLDNLSKGAASQALQNINIALDLKSLESTLWVENHKIRRAK